MKSLRSPRGFTLVEVLVTSVLTAIVGAFFIAFMRMHNHAIDEGASRSIMQMRSDIVSSEIARKVRAANQALAPGEAWALNQGLAASDVSEIILYNRSGNMIGAYKIENGALKESADGANFQFFLSGGEQVRMAAGSAFRLSGDRKEVTLLLKVALLYRNTNYETPAKGDMYLCRN